MKDLQIYAYNQTGVCGVVCKTLVQAYLESGPELSYYCARNLIRVLNRWQGLSVPLTPEVAAAAAARLCGHI